MIDNLEKFGNEFNIQESNLRINNLLRKDEQEAISTALVEVAENRLGVVQAIRNAGLVHNLGSIGITTSTYEKVSNMEDADVTMQLIDVNSDKVEFKPVSTIVPVFSKDFRINLRALEASRKMGESLDTTTIKLATRQVLEQFEKVSCQGTTAVGTITGLQNATNANTEAMTANWATVTTTPAAIVAEIGEMLQELYADNFFGPYNLFVSKDIWTRMHEDYNAGYSTDTLMERILRIPGINGVVAGDQMTTARAVLAQMTSDVMDLAIGADLKYDVWSPSPYETRFKVYMVGVCRFKSDYDGKSGIVVCS